MSTNITGSTDEQRALRRQRNADEDARREKVDSGGALAVLAEIPELLILAATAPFNDRLRGASLRVRDARQSLADALAQRDAEIARLRANAARYLTIKKNARVETSDWKSSSGNLQLWRLDLFVGSRFDPDVECCGQYGVNENGARECFYCDRAARRITDEAIDAAIAAQPIAPQPNAEVK